MMFVWFIIAVVFVLPGIAVVIRNFRERQPINQRISQPQ
jgi:uncharacterized membrane protein YhaH (DUF805 family)